jgi:hypothetical protein
VDGITYIGVGSSDASWPSKARRPVLNLGTFLSWAFCLLRPRGIRVPVPWRLVITPRVSRRLAAARKERYLSYTATYIYFLSDPPRQRYSTREFQPRRLDSCVQTRSCRIGKACPCLRVLNESTRAMSSRGMTVRKSTH